MASLLLPVVLRKVQLPPQGALGRALERFPEGQEPKTEWVYAEPTPDKWGPVLAQDKGKSDDKE